MRRNPLVFVPLAAAVVMAGCFNPFSPQVLTQRVTTVAPSPTTPQNAVKLFEWCWKNRGVEEYKELFTADYLFASATTDSAGNTTRDVLTRRDDEVETAQNMFVGSAERPPAAKITLSFDQNLVPFPDPRPGKNPIWHKTIRTSVDLTVEIEQNNLLEVTGHALFFLTRGDSAAIPTELKSRFGPDSLRWWIDRWEDETIGSAGVAAAVRRARPGASQEVFERSMAEVKAYFLSRPLALAPSAR